MAANEKRAAHLAEHPVCQIYPVLKRYVVLPKHITRTTAVHHIWGRGNNREVWSNYLTVRPDSHDWLHDNPAAGRIAELWTKHQLRMRTGIGAHFDVGELDAAARKSVSGWIEMKLHLVPTWCRMLGEDFLEMIG